MEGALRRRFRTDLAGLIGPERQRIGVAISGGPDSLALLLLAHDALGDAIAAATVDHRLRTESTDEAEHVAQICGALGIPHAILTPNEPITGNLQAGARAARYALLESWREREGLDWIATAHHADDQLETVLMRLFRGSGIDGLAGVRRINGKVIRPLLGFRKAELDAIVAGSVFKPVDDPSNRDVRFDRTNLRTALAGLAFEPGRLARTAAAIGEASIALGWSTQKEAARAIRENDGVILIDPEGLPREILRRLVVTCLVRFDPDRPPRGTALDALIDNLERGGISTIGVVLCEGGRTWRFRKAPARRTG